MDTLDKKSLLEKQIEDEYIVSALKGKGWQNWQIARQESYTAGRIIVRRGSANLWTRGERKIPDFVLYHVSHLPLAVIEAKDNNHTVEHGLRQALEYADAGRAELENFQSKEPKYPIVVTTSKLLTTGVNAPTVKLIVLDAFIQSRTEFKQIIGRGTRIAEKFGKVFFTIIDFRGSTQQFYDPDFDGNPLPLDDFDETELTAPAVERAQPKPEDDTGGQRKYVVDGVQVDVVMETVRYYDGAGRIMHENLTDYTRRNILENFADLDDFLTRWNEADRKEALLDELRAHGILTDALKDETGERFKQLDDFDLICHLAFGAKPLTRAERANNVQKRDIYARFGGQARQVLDALLQKYADERIASIEDTQDLKVRPFTDIGTPVEIVKMFGGKDAYFAMLAELKNELYGQSA